MVFVGQTFNVADVVATENDEIVVIEGPFVAAHFTYKAATFFIINTYKPLVLAHFPRSINNFQSLSTLAVADI